MRRYEIRVTGELSPRTRDALTMLDLVPQPTETVMLAPAGDEAYLRGVLDALQDLGLELVAVHQLPD